MIPLARVAMGLTVALGLAATFSRDEALAMTLCGRAFTDVDDLMTGLMASGARVVERGSTSISMEEAGSKTLWVFVDPGRTAAGVYCKPPNADVEVVCKGSRQSCDALAGKDTSANAGPGTALAPPRPDTLPKSLRKGSSLP